MRDFRDAKAMAGTLRAALAAKGLKITVQRKPRTDRQGAWRCRLEHAERRGSREGACSAQWILPVAASSRRKSSRTRAALFARARVDTAPRFRRRQSPKARLRDAGASPARPDRRPGRFGSDEGLQRRSWRAKKEPRHLASRTWPVKTRWTSSSTAPARRA